MQDSPRRGIDYPNLDRSDRPDVPAHILNLVNALEVDVIFAQGTTAARAGAAHMSGVVWRETDTGLFFWDTGAIWVPLGTMIKDDLYANRPLANSLPNGARFYATDTGGLFVTNGAAWSLIGHAAFLKTAAEFGAAPYNAPYDGMEVRILVDAANGTVWHMRYNAGSASAYKWEAVASAAMISEIDTSETTASTTFVDLSTAGPSLTVPRNGDYHIEYGMGGINAGGTGNPVSSLSIGGGAPATADEIGIFGQPTNLQTAARHRKKAGLTAAQVVKMQYRTTGSTSSFLNRWLNIRPLRIS